MGCLKCWCHCSQTSLTSQAFCVISGHHSSVREEPLSYPVPQLYDDFCAQGQPGGKLHDHHDRHCVSGQEERWCKALSYLTLNYCLKCFSGCDSVSIPCKLQGFTFQFLILISTKLTCCQSLTWHQVTTQGLLHKDLSSQDSTAGVYLAQLDA